MAWLHQSRLDDLLNHNASLDTLLEQEDFLPEAKSPNEKLLAV